MKARNRISGSISDLVSLNLIRALCGAHSIDTELVLAIIWRESKGECFKTKFDLKSFENNEFYYPHTFAEKLSITLETEKSLQAMRWGPMQILGSDARKLGYEDDLLKLTVPDVSLAWSIKKLDELLVKYKLVDRAIAAWNSGSPKTLNNGEFTNQGYVTDVLHYIQRIKQEFST